MEKKGYILPLVIIMLMLSTCSRFEKIMMVTTGKLEDVARNSANISGVIIDTGEGKFKAGHCFDKTPGVSVLSPKTMITNLNNPGSFFSDLLSLEAETKYYVKAYISDEDEEIVVYGKEISFMTLPAGIPSVTTTEISGITQTSCLTGGTVTDDGGIPVTSRGVCWDDIDENPGIDGNINDNGEGAGIFLSEITGLTGNTRYFVRAYAINEKGTAYGNPISFKTGPVVPVLTTADPFPVTLSTATCGGEITGDGGAPVTSRGVCWRIGGTPTILDFKTTDGEGTGVFKSHLTALKSDTEYHIRAYAANSAGIGYGGEKILRTDPATTTDIEGNVYHTVRIGTQLWMKENLRTTKYKDGSNIPLVTDITEWRNLLTPAFCWYNNDPGTYRLVYGALYNWYAVNTGKLCPAGWHVPVDAEWTVMTNFLGGVNVAGGKMKEEGSLHWDSPNTGATNESGFTGLPGGIRGSDSVFGKIGKYGYHWTNTPTSDPDYAWGWVLQYDSAEILRRNYYYRKNGFSVRCIRDQ